MTVTPASSSDVPARRQADTIPVIVQGIGYKITHVAMIAVSDLRMYAWDGYHYDSEPFIGLPVPVTASCGRRVSSRAPVVQVFPRWWLVRCAGCRRDYGQAPQLPAPFPVMRPERIEWRDEYREIVREEYDDGGF